MRIGRPATSGHATRPLGEGDLYGGLRVYQVVGVPGRDGRFVARDDVRPNPAGKAHDNPLGAVALDGPNLAAGKAYPPAHETA